MDLVVIEKEYIANNTVQIRLSSPKKEILPSFQPGAHIEISFNKITRHYSLASSPENLSFYEICVLRREHSRGGSSFIYDELDVGDHLEVSTPMNAFKLKKDAKYSVFIAGGIGITPFFNMIEELHREKKSFELHYAARSEKHVINTDRLLGKTCFYPNKDGHRTLDIDLLLDRLDHSMHIYVCGPRTMIEDVRHGASKRGWADNNIHFESFGSSPKKDDKPITIKLAISGIELNVQPDQTILDALLENGIWAPYECKRGECASCITEVLSGHPDHRDVCLSEEQRKYNMCTCVSWSKAEELELNL